MWFQALNNASRNDKTNALLDRTHRLHQDHTSIIVAKVWMFPLARVSL